jgi:hypothetical protein
MEPQNRNLIILGILLGLWGLVFAFRTPTKAPTRTEVRSASTTPRTPRASGPAQGGGLPRLKRELLNAPRPPYPPEARSIFGTPPPPPPPQAAVTPPPSVAPAAPPPPPPDPFQEEAKRLRYVGFLQAEEKTMAFIVQGTEVHTVEVGATLLGRFRIQTVTEEAVLLSSVSGDKQVRLPLLQDAGASPRK